AKPGVVLKRPVGSKGAFSENAPLPKVAVPRRSSSAASAPDSPKTEDRLSKRRGDKEERQAKAAARRQAITQQKRVAAYEKAERRHTAAVDLLNEERDALDRRIEKEDERWFREKKSLVPKA
ncbi:MAG: hypothetical protein M3N08_08010, partial [Pseudomonadota bacterium]|nr:hypothetical protein [Pseudomonadota bacterium]